jgi:hypothetical protein
VRGASALGAALAAHPRADVRVLVIWLPVLDSDTAPPTAMVRRPLAVDPRVTEFWDPSHWASPRMLERAARFDPDAARPGAVAWDVIATYPPGASWEDPFPAPTWYGYPVVEHGREINETLARTAPRPQ